MCLMVWVFIVGLSFLSLEYEPGASLYLDIKTHKNRAGRPAAAIPARCHSLSHLSPHSRGQTELTSLLVWCGSRAVSISQNQALRIAIKRNCVSGKQFLFRFLFYSNFGSNSTKIAESCRGIRITILKESELNTALYGSPPTHTLSPSPHSPLLCCYLSFSSSLRIRRASEPTLMMLHLALRNAAAARSSCVTAVAGTSCCCRRGTNFGQSGPAIRERRLLPAWQAFLNGQIPRVRIRR